MKYASMVKVLLGCTALSVLAACGGSDGGGGSSGENSPSPITISLPETPISPGQEISYCFYFHFPSSGTVHVKSWKGTFSRAVQRAAIFFTDGDVQPAGTLDGIGGSCGPGLNTPSGTGAAKYPTWAFSANQSGEEYTFPTDDGTGKPLGLEVRAGQSGYLWVHVANPDLVATTARADLTASFYPENTAVTRADSYTTYHSSLNIPPLGQNVIQPMTCPALSGMKLITASVHGNKQIVHTELKGEIGGSSTLLFSSDFWDNPGLARLEPGYPTPTKLTYECTYNAFGSTRAIHTGNSVTNDELCMAHGYYFPATKPVGCFSNLPMQ